MAGRLTRIKYLGDGQTSFFWRYQWAHVQKVCIYHLLCAAFGQCVPVAQIVDFNVFDIITILRVDFLIEWASL